MANCRKCGAEKVIRTSKDGRFDYVVCPKCKPDASTPPMADPKRPDALPKLPEKPGGENPPASQRKFLGEYLRGTILKR